MFNPELVSSQLVQLLAALGLISTLALSLLMGFVGMG